MASNKIDINKADIEELSSLNGVGRAKAESIIDTRKVLGLYVIFLIIVKMNRSSNLVPIWGNMGFLLQFSVGLRVMTQV